MVYCYTTKRGKLVSRYMEDVRMRIGLERRDALAGTGYAVSAHLAEGGAAALFRARFPAVTEVLLHHTDDGEAPMILGISSMLAAAGYAIKDWDGSSEMPALHRETGMLLTVGDMHTMVVGADARGDGEEALPHVWWIDHPREAFCIPPIGVRRADLTVADPALFTEEVWCEAVPYAARLGVLFDRDLFSLVYSTYDPVTLLVRGCRLVQDLLAEDRGNVRARLAFGGMMAQVVDRLADGELAPHESLAIGMVYEARLGAKLGVSNPRKLADLDGTLTYHGLPRAVAATAEELVGAFDVLYGGRDTLPFTLPTAIGKCRTADYKAETIRRFIGELSN